ncbi:hypothetical protein WJU23_18860 [Prosthecobacter sp. SYSU 5D2]|uniref:hypothetical protein n=1 Tax=Prosthecobacter sp. SYSU 5D2 TaxID=3134134 RepID=UPI0031FF09CF
MNPNENTPANVCNNTIETLENRVREHPASTLLMVAGLGVAAVFLARALIPAPTPQSRAMDVLEDIQDRLAELAEEGALAVRRGADRVGDLPIERTLNRMSRGLKGLFH